MSDSDWHPLRGTDWRRLLRRELEDDYWAALQLFLGEERSHFDVHPLDDEVFAALRLTKCRQTKVVIVGQDPYPGLGVANGLAFSVRRGVRVPPTLANIYRELRGDGVSTPTHGNLEAWARQGVLLLNATLTELAGGRALHQRAWKALTDAVICVVDRQADPVFVLWGREAQKKKRLIDPRPGKIIESPHPSPLSAYRGFFGSHPFRLTNQALDISGRGVIDWELPE